MSACQISFAKPRFDDDVLPVLTFPRLRRTVRVFAHTQKRVYLPASAISTSRRESTPEIYFSSYTNATQLLYQKQERFRVFKFLLLPLSSLHTTSTLDIIFTFYITVLGAVVPARLLILSLHSLTE